MRVIYPGTYSNLDGAEEHLRELVEAIKGYRSANADFISSALDAKLSKKDSERLRSQLSKVEPAYWRIEHHLEMLEDYVKKLRENEKAQNP